MNLKPVIILGAPRSGTNMLRDILCQHPFLNTWNCDEINPIWKYNNYSKSDELKPKDFNEKIQQYIYSRFLKISKNNTLTVVEKTCANTLRPEFIYKLFPKAKYLFIYRNGYDCAISAKMKKKSRFNLIYLLKKLRYAPINSIPYLIFKKINSKLWGPNYIGMQEDKEKLSDLELYSKQWMKCNQEVLNFLSSYPQANYKLINYEEFVNNPEIKMNEIFNFIQLQNKLNFTFKTDHIFVTSVGNSEKSLTKEEKSLISKYVDKVNKKLNI